MLKKQPNIIIRFFGHLNNILTHKYWVFVCCCKIGMPIRGILHDMSKFHPIEFWEGVHYYHDRHSSPINYAKKDKGYSKAWFHHRNHNKHHYEHWMDNFDQGGENILMPCKYAQEMLCDYIGAGIAYNGKTNIYQNELIWWNNRLKNPIAMHPALQAFVTNCLTYMADTEHFIPKEKAIQYYCLETSSYKEKSL